MNRLVSLLLCFAMALSMLTGCSGNTVAPGGSTSASSASDAASVASSDASAAVPITETKKNTFVVGGTNEPPSIDPGKVSGTVAAPMVFAMYESLVTIDPSTGESIPGAAESWEISNDGLVYTFKLRQDAKWSDGSPVTAKDYVYAWLRVLNPETASTYSWYVQMFIKNATEYSAGKAAAEDVGVKAISDYVLEVTLKQPTTYFIQALLNSIWVPVREDMVSKNPDKWIFDASTNIGNGAYQLVEYKIGEYILVEKNEHYWNKQADTVQNIKFIFLPDANTCYASFQTGEIHATMDIPAADIAQLIANDKRLHLQNGFNSSFIRLNTREKGLDDAKVRRAISLAFDREAYLEGIGSNMSQPAVGAVPDEVVLAGKNFRETAGTYGLTYKAQVEQAKALLAEAGYPEGEGLPVYAIHCTDKQIKNAEILQEQLKVNLGIQTTIAPVDTKMFFPMMVEGKYQIGFGGWSGKYNHPMTFLELFASTASDNCTGWANAEYDQLLNTARAEPDEAKQLEMLAKAESLLITEAPILAVSFPVLTILVADNVSGWHLTPSQQLRVSQVVMK